jgi:hypothetical protein
MNEVLQSANGWESIETAPKDAPWLLLYKPGHPVTIGYWDAMLDPDTYQSRWTAVHESGILIRFCPTHWMPVPEPPDVVDESAVSYEI